MKIAQDSGNRYVESNIAITLSRLAALQVDPSEAFDFLVLAIRNYQQSGSFALTHGPLGILAAFFDRLGCHEAAATIMGFAALPITRLAFPEVDAALTHLREVLGEDTYESFARTGANMTSAAMAAYAFEHIDLARADLLQADGSS